MVLAMSIFVGGMLQIIAGLFAFCKENTFFATASCAYGAFYLSLVAEWLLPSITHESSAHAPGETAMGMYLFCWFLFTLFMYIGALHTSKMY